MGFIVPPEMAVENLRKRVDSMILPGATEVAGFFTPLINTGLNHWQLWTLICLARHSDRQKWLGYIIESRLNTDLSQIGVRGSLGQPTQIAPRGQVPGEPEWIYSFHGRGCC